MSENKESVLSKGSGLYILLGVAFAVLAMFFVTVVALESVLFSPSYYIKLEDSFKMSEQMDLTKDGYIRYYNCYMNYISEGDQTAEERGYYVFLSIAKWVALALCAGILIIVFVRATKAEVRIIGRSSGIAVPLLAAILYVVYLLIDKSAFPFIPNLAQDGLLHIFLNSQVTEKFYSSWITMCIVFSVAPLAVSLFFAKVGRRKHEDLSDDYMYQ